MVDEYAGMKEDTMELIFCSGIIEKIKKKLLNFGSEYSFT
jgi:hypothetical protein